MNSYYLEKLGVKSEDIVQNWNPDDHRKNKWAKERKKFGFDERETWNFDTTFLQWVYPRICWYREHAPVDLTYHQYKYKKQFVTFEWCLDAMIESLGICLLNDRLGPKAEKEYKRHLDKFFDIFRLCFNSMWW